MRLRAAAMIALLGMGLVATTPAPIGPTAVQAEGGGIQPGDLYNDICTLNFVFDGQGHLAGKVYIGTAGHCTDLGDSANTPGFSDFGTTVYDDDDVDFALIEVHSAFHGHVNPAVAGHPQTPTGVAQAAETATGDQLVLSGYGMVVGWHYLTRENRIGVLQSDSPTTFTAQTMLINGDSGGPIVHERTGKALGIVSHLPIGNLPPATDAGPTVNGAITSAAANGFPVALRAA